MKARHVGVIAAVAVVCTSVVGIFVVKTNAVFKPSQVVHNPNIKSNNVQAIIEMYTKEKEEVESAEQKNVEQRNVNITVSEPAIPQDPNNPIQVPTKTQYDASNPNITEWDFDGDKVWIEAQRGAPWNTYVATNGGSTVQGAGCMMYAAAIAGSWSTGSKKCVYDVITGMGYDVVTSGSSYKNIGNNKLPYVGNNGPVTYAKAMTAGGVQSVHSDLGSNLDDGLAQLKDKSCKGLVVHCDSDPNKKVSSSGQHWFCILKYDATKGYLVASSNTRKQGWMSKDGFANTVHYNHVVPFD